MEKWNALLRQEPEQALSRMLSDYGGLVYYVVRGILSECPAEDVEECVSDTFLYVFEHRSRLDFSKGSLKAYLCAVAKNKAFDRLRRFRREQSVRGAGVRRPEVFPSAEELALSHAERDAIIEGILALGDPDARILICRYDLCMRTSEIAQLTGLKENTVDQRARRALKKLSAQLDEGGIRNAESAL